MDPDLFDTLACEVAERTFDLLFAEQVVPRPERTGAVLSGRIGKLRFHLRVEKEVGSLD